MADTLMTTTASGAQTATQNPQTAGAASTGASQTSDIQPGTPADTLNNTNGISLQNNQIATIPLNSKATVSVAQPVSKHHAGPLLTGISVILFIVAIAIFALLSRAEKTTTN